MIRMGGRAVEGTGLENRQGSSPRGFESHPIRHRLKTNLALCPFPEKLHTLKKEVWSFLLWEIKILAIDWFAPAR